MRKFIVLTVIVLFFLVQLGTAGADTGKKEWLQRIYKLYGEAKYMDALYAIEQALKAMGSSNELLQLKYNILV